MVVTTEKQTAYQKALLIASGPAMLERMVRPLKDAGLSVNACEHFIDAKGLFEQQALIVLPIKDDDQEDAKAFIDWIRKRASAYILGVGRCDEGQRQGLVAKMGLNDLITMPFDESEVQERLASFRNWSRLPDDKDKGAAETETIITSGEPLVPSELLQTSRVSLFAGSPSGEEEEETAESIYCREAPVGIAMFDRDLRYLLANPRWIQQFRLKDKEVIGRSQFEVFPSLHPNWNKIYTRCLNGETRRGREMVEAGHGPVEMRWEVRPWRYRAGQIGGVTIAFEEVWKSAEQTPSSSVKDIREPSISVPAQLKGPSLLLDLQGDVLELNEAAKALGVAAPEMAFVKALKDDVSALPLTDLVDHVDPVTKKAGRLAWSNTVLRDADGRPEKILRVGVFLSESLLPAMEKIIEIPQELKPVFSGRSLTLLGKAPDYSADEDETAGEIDSFEDGDLDELSQLVWKANTRGEITFFNEAWLTYRDRPLARELNGGWLAGLHASDARETKAVVEEAIREQKSLEHSFRLKSGEGMFSPVHMWVRPFYAENGDLLGFYGACDMAPALGEADSLKSFLDEPSSHSQPVDATLWPDLQKEANEALVKVAEAEREILKLREALTAAQEQSEKTPEPTTPDNVFAAAPVMLWTCDAKGHLTAVNRQWERFRGKTAEEGLDDAWLEAIASEDERQSTHRQLCEAAKEGKPLKCRFTWTDSDGASRVVELYGSPLVDSDGQCDGLTGAVRDITEECAVLSTVREVVAPENESPEAGVPSEIYQLLSSKLPGWRERQSLAASDLAAFREIFDHVGAGIVLLGADAKPLFANHRHRDLLGFSIEEAGDMESWLRRACGDQAHADAVMKIWHEDVWQRQLTKVLALKTANGALREIKLEPQLFLDDNRLLLTMHDVTESKRSEEAMRDSEIRFRALFRESSMGIALIDSEEKIYDINPALEKVLGVARRQILCRSFDECLNQEDLPKKQTVLKDLLASPRRSAMVELRLARPKADEEVSRVVWVRLHISLVRDVDQRVLFTAYFVQDITEQRQVQEELRISQEQNRALLEVIPNLILLVNRKGEVIDLMPGESQTIALEEEEAMGKPIGQVIPAFEGKFTKLIREAYSLDDVVHFQFTGPGENETYLARIVACKPESVIITIDQDGPVAQPAPAEIPEALQLQSMSFENGPDAVVITNYAGAILDWNPAAVALFGYEKSDALGQPLPALFGVDSVEALTRHLQPVDQSDRWSGQISFRRKDRSEGLADVVFRPLKGEGGRLAGQAAFIREAFVPPKVEVDPKAREALIEEIREDSMVKLVPQMHQRLRNNLQIIGTLLNLQFKGQTDPAMRQALRTSRNRAHTLLILHEQIRAQEDEEAINFQDLAEQVAANLLTSFDVSDRIQISVDIGDVLDLHAASPLSLILNELVSNAIRHGFPKTESGQVRISMKIADGKGHLAVSDDGIGEQASASSGSPGMGLQIVKTLANQIGGSLERIDTTETEFRVYFTTALRK